MQVTITNETGVWKKASVVLSGLFAFITAFGPMIIESWALIPDSLREALPDGVARWVSVIAFLLIIAGRYMYVKPTPKPVDPA